MSVHVKIVQDLTKKGFTKVTIINKSYQCVGASAQDHVATAWKNDAGTTINENQELKDDWEKTKDKGTFHFYKKKWTFVGNSNSATEMNLKRKKENKKDNNLLLVRDRENHWIIAAGKIAGAMDKKKDKDAFKDFNAAISALEDVLGEHGYEADD